MGLLYYIASICPFNVYDRSSVPGRGNRFGNLRYCEMTRATALLWGCAECVGILTRELMSRGMEGSLNITAFPVGCLQKLMIQRPDL